MKKSKFTESQIITVINEIEGDLTVDEVARELKVSKGPINTYLVIYLKLTL